jgi:hypothetical protein
LRDSVALQACNAFIDGRDFALPTGAAGDVELAGNRG